MLSFLKTGIGTGTGSNLIATAAVGDFCCLQNRQISLAGSGPRFRIPTDPDPGPGAHLIRIQSGSGSATLASRV